LNGHHAELEETPAGRVAAFVREWLYTDWPPHLRNLPPDYADLREAISYIVDRELLLARIEEARGMGNRPRMLMLATDLMAHDLAHGKKIQPVKPPEDK
jgi:hypothetical protein